MTIGTQTCKVVVQGNDVLTTFNYSFLVPSATGTAQLWLQDADGVISLVNPDQYTINSAGNPAGGTFTYPLTGSPLATGETLTLIRTTPYTQVTNFANQGAFYPASVEDADDWLAQQTQQLNERAGRAIVGPVSEPGFASTLPPAAERAGGFLAFDDSGEPTVLTGVVPDDVPVSPFMELVLLATDAASAQTALGISAYAQTLLDDADAAAAQATLDLVPGTDVQPYDADTAKTDVTNTWTQGQTFTASGVAITVQLSDDSAGAGPFIDRVRISASPAASDALAIDRDRGRNSAANPVTYFQDFGAIGSPTAGAEYGHKVFQAIVNGALTTVLTVGPGILGAAATGGMPATPGHANLIQVAEQGVALGSNSKPMWLVNKGGVDQTGIASATPTAITWGVESIDRGGIFASNQAIPPANTTVFVVAVVQVTAGIVDQNNYTLFIAKNGVGAYGNTVRSSGTGALTVAVEGLVACNGTDTISVIFEGGGAGNKTVGGNAAITTFMGWAA